MQRRELLVTHTARRVQRAAPLTPTPLSLTPRRASPHRTGTKMTGHFQGWVEETVRAKLEICDNAAVRGARGARRKPHWR